MASVSPDQLVRCRGNPIACGLGKHLSPFGIEDDGPRIDAATLYRSNVNEQLSPQAFGRTTIFINLY